MKALSIQQPWAWAILHAGKDVENRSWSTKFRGTFLIHASRTIDNYGYDFIFNRFGIVPPPKSEIDRGGIVGIAEIVDCVDCSNSRWFCGKYGYVLRNPKPIELIKINGQLGFFETPITLQWIFNY
jgi:hypothetical protein